MTDDKKRNVYIEDITVELTKVVTLKQLLGSPLITRSDDGPSCDVIWEWLVLLHCNFYILVNFRFRDDLVLGCMTALPGDHRFLMNWIWEFERKSIDTTHICFINTQWFHGLSPLYSILCIHIYVASDASIFSRVCIISDFLIGPFVDMTVNEIDI